MQTRNNEEIIKLCAEASQFNRQLMVSLIQAGAPLDILQNFIHMGEAMDNVAMRFSNDTRGQHGPMEVRAAYPDEYHHGVETLAKGMALAGEVVAPVLQQLTDAIAKLETIQTSES